MGALRCASLSRAAEGEDCAAEGEGCAAEGEDRSAEGEDCAAEVGETRIGILGKPLSERHRCLHNFNKFDIFHDLGSFHFFGNPTIFATETYEILSFPVYFLDSN